MKYLCMAYGDKAKVQAVPKEEFEALMPQLRACDEELQRTGQVVMVESLEWDVTTLRPKNGKPVVSDGPFVETKETVGGLFIIEARDLNDAIRVASLHPAARMCGELGFGIEIRPIASGCHQ
jgi:hypothetical protein